MFILSCLYLSLLFHVIKLYLVASPLESYAMTKNSLKCQRNCEESSLVIGESVDLAFEDSNNIRQDIISCKWIFIPLHDRNYVEMHARNVQATDCSISYIAVYVSNKFTKKICDFESIRGFKFIGKSISLSYNCLNSSRCGYKLEVTVRETSPVVAGCDFTMTEMGYRYYLKYDLIDSKAETSNQVKNGCPFPGMSLDNIRYNLYFMNRENLGVTTCFQDQIILPREDVPSCHASTEDCEWKLIEGIEKVNEIFELRGPQWKITKEGLFQTKSRNIQIESFCLYFEYFLDNVEMARITIVSYQPKQFPRTREVHVNENLTSKVWTIKRFVGDINQKRGRNDLKTMFELRIRIHDNKNNGAMYINKIYGCDPFTKEDRIFIPTGPRKMLYGSFRKESNETNCCENGGKWIDEKCICPIGFNGKHCRVDCGENRYGHNCGLECDLFKKGCEDIIICDDFLGCSCAPGFKGRYCQDCGSSSLYEEYEYFDKETCANGTGRSFATCRNVLDPPDCTNSIPRYSMVTIPRYIKFDEVSVFWSKEEVNNSTCDVKMLQFTIRSGSNLKRYMVMSHLIYFTFKNLRSGTKYTVRMKPILKGDPLCPFLTFTTPHRHPREF